MTLLSEIYDISNIKGNLRGKAKSGLIRPTVNQFFTSADWANILKPQPLPRIGYETKVATAGAHVTTSHNTIAAVNTPWAILQQGVTGSWCPLLNSDTEPAWFVVQMLTPKRIEKLVVASPTATSGYEQLKDFKLEASNTGEFSGEEILLYSGTITEGSGSNKVCEFINNYYYTYYRFVALSNYHGSGGSDRSTTLVSLYQGTYTEAPTLPTSFGADQCYGGTVTSWPAHISSYAATNLFGNSVSFWMPSIEENIEAVSWVVYEFPTTKQIQKLRIQSVYITGYEPIAGFKFEGSNTGAFTGEQEVFLTTVHENNFVNAFQDYVFINNNSYKYYRLYIYSHHVGNGGNDRRVDNIQMLEAL